MLKKDKGQKLCEIMSLLSEELCPLCSETTFAMPGFMCRQHRRALEGRQGISPIRPLSSPGCHKPLISHSPRRAGLTPDCLHSAFLPKKPHTSAPWSWSHAPPLDDTWEYTALAWRCDTSDGGKQHILENTDFRIHSPLH